MYALTADDVEFWQADRQRRHTRLRYQRDLGRNPVLRPGG
ncbi:pyridoxine 5'-phosphate oxidase C-terminal domain-containing protein [Planotetraspora sp. GP83]